jgi:hypothetical protein
MSRYAAVIRLIKAQEPVVVSPQMAARLAAAVKGAKAALQDAKAAVGSKQQAQSSRANIITRVLRI